MEMTVCLAALCESDGNQLAVIASDRMVTLGNLIEFEHASPKMAYPSAQSIALIAGDTLMGTRLAKEVETALTGTNPRISDIASALGEKYTAKRQEAMEHAVLRPRGLDLNSFYGAHATLNQQITMMLDNALSEFNLGVELLLAGVDGDGAHVFSIHNPGGPEMQHDVIGYGAIGSGAIHAHQSLIGFGHHAGASFRDTLFRVYASKRRSEVAPGVGHETDVIVVTQTSRFHLDTDQVKELSDLFDGYEDSTKASLKEKLDELTIEVLESEGDNEPNDSND